MSPTPWDLPPRIAAKIAVDADTGCWLWTAARRKTGGYGVVGIPGTRSTTPAHRFVYEAIAYEIPEGLQLDHLCRVKRCLNPAHLEPVTGAENVRRGMSLVQLRPTYPCGHERTDENTRILYRHGKRADGRVCFECHRNKYGARRKVAAA